MPHLRLSNERRVETIALISAFVEKQKERHLEPEADADGTIRLFANFEKNFLEDNEEEENFEWLHLRETLLGYSLQEVRELVTIMHTGRGDWPPQEFWQQYNASVDAGAMDSQGQTVDYMLSKTNLLTQVGQGFDLLNHAGVI